MNNNLNDKKRKITTAPYKGARDFYPEDMRIRNYIFDVWRKVCKRYGYEEYDAPILEPFELYEAKSGEEIVQKQLYWFTDRGGRKIALRPEKTPSLARMIASRSKTLIKPIRWFNIGNCWRYEKPQRGRGREFWCLDCDILGVNSIMGDVEVFTIPVEIMKELGAREGMFEIRVSNRKFTEFYLREVVGVSGSIEKQNTQMHKVIKALDARPKITEQEYFSKLKENGLSKKQIAKIEEFTNSDLSFVKQYASESEGAKELIEFLKIMKDMGNESFYKFSPCIVRGLDYYTGIVIEQFDLDPKNTRAMFGGGRYDNLLSIFTEEKIPGTGFGMGDITLTEFLKNWNLLPNLSTETKVYVTLFAEEFRERSLEIARRLRVAGINTAQALEANKLDKQLKYADRSGIPYAIIIGPEEATKGVVKLKDMIAKKQEEFTVEQVIEKLKKKEENSKPA